MSLQLDGLTLGEIENCENLFFVRIYGEDKFKEDVFTLDEAFETNYFTVIDTGEVDYLQIENKLDHMVFVNSGMIFEGNGTQNRAAQFSAIIKANLDTKYFPVRCAEQGQPLKRGAKFEHTTTIITANARTGIVDQQKTWDRISDTQTITMLGHTQDYASSIKYANLEDYLEVLGEPKKGQVGYLAAIKGRKVNFYSDIFGNHELYSKLHKRLHESVAVVAKQTNYFSEEVKWDRFEEFIDLTKKLDLIKQPLSKGLAGRIYVIENPIKGTVLTYENIPVQVSLRKE